MDLEFRNLTYTVQSRIPKSPKKVVVKGVHGRFLSGQLVAIMGPSGAGKSSLLNIISGYRSAGVTGELLVNGQPRNEHLFQRSSCYITQEDLLQPLLTVREAMDVAARLKLPKGLKAPSEEILQELGLLEHQNTRTDELSGGQKKRLSIALEMVNNPPVFFLDEPTSGLDNVTTTQCVKLLKQLARQGRTVVCTIHQPPASLLELFDQDEKRTTLFEDDQRRQEFQKNDPNTLYKYMTFINRLNKGFKILDSLLTVQKCCFIISLRKASIIIALLGIFNLLMSPLYLKIGNISHFGTFSFFSYLMVFANIIYGICCVILLYGVMKVYVIADGRCIYQGDYPAMVPFLQGVGLPCPRHHNPADFIIELTENPAYITILANEILNGKVHKSSKLDCPPSEAVNLPAMQLKISYQTDDNDIETEIMLSNEKCTYKVPQYNETSVSLSSLSSQVSHVNSSMAWMKVQYSRDSCGYPTSFLEQFSILLFRMIKQISRNRQGLWIQLIHHIMCGILIGICFFNMANDGTQMFNHLKLCVGLVIFFAYTQIMVPVLVYPQEVKLVKKEHFNCWYSLTPYYAALTVSKLPVQVTLNIVFCTIVFFMAGVPFTPLRFAVFCVVGNVVSLAAEGMGMAIGSIFSVRNGCAIGPAAIAPFLGLGIYGFDFAHQIPLMMNILMKTSFIRCGIVAMVLTIFGFNRAPLECTDVYCHFAKPEVLIKYLDIETSSVWFEIITMIGIMLVFRSVCFLGLRWRFAT